MPAMQTYNACIVSIQPSTTYLGEFEYAVLLAILHLRTRMRCRCVSCSKSAPAVPVARGALYTALERLEIKGCLKSRMGEPTDERGGKPRRYFSVTAAWTARAQDDARRVRQPDARLRNHSGGTASSLPPPTHRAIHGIGRPGRRAAPRCDSSRRGVARQHPRRPARGVRDASSGNEATLARGGGIGAVAGIGGRVVLARASWRRRQLSFPAPDPRTRSRGMADRPHSRPPPRVAGGDATAGDQRRDRRDAGARAGGQQHEFRVLDALVLRPFRFPGVDRIVMVASSDPNQGFFDRESVPPATSATGARHANLSNCRPRNGGTRTFPGSNSPSRFPRFG